MIQTAIYRSVIGAYTLGIRVFSLFNAKAKLFISGREKILKKIAKALKSEKRPRIWIHCASLGEFEQGRPVLEAIRGRHTEYAIVLTFFSPSGYEVRKDYKGADYVFYLPVDSHKNATAFLDLVKPKLCLFIKYELWYFYLTALKERKIPTMLISAVFNNGQGFFKWYGGLQRTMLQCFSQIFVQDAGSVDLLQTIGITNVTISGDTRFDRVIKATTELASLLIAEEFCKGSNIIVAGSTWKEDEVLLHKTMSSSSLNWKMILVPHEVHKEHIEEIERLFGDDIVKWSSWNGKTDKRVLLVDKVGLLLQLYRYGQVAWIGGGFGKAGVHNVLEAAVFSLPCLHGPVYHQFLEANELVAQGGAFVINTPDDLIGSLNAFEDKSVYEKASSAAREYVFSMQGATDKVMSEVNKMLERS